MSETAEAPFIHESDGDHDRSTDEILRDIERRREAIARTVDQAGRKVEESLDWREQVRDHPYGALALVSGTAFVATQLLRHGKTPTERLTATLSDSLEEIGGSLRRSIDTIGRSHTGIARTVATTLAAIAVRSIINTVRRQSSTTHNPNRTGGERHES